MEKRDVAHRPCRTGRGSASRGEEENQDARWHYDGSGSRLIIEGNGPVRGSDGWERAEEVLIADGITSIENRAFQGCASLRSITIPDSVKSIGNRAFDGCITLQAITIPSGVTAIWNQAFSGCDSLRRISVDGDNAAFASVDGCLYTRDLGTLVRVPPGYEGTAFEAIDTVTHID